MFFVIESTIILFSLFFVFRIKKPGNTRKPEFLIGQFTRNPVFKTENPIPESLDRTRKSALALKRYLKDKNGAL